MRKEFLFLLLLGMLITTCETSSKKANLPTENIVHKLNGGAPLTLPESFIEIKSEENLKVKLNETENFNPILFKNLQFDFKMNHQLFFDFISGPKMMYLTVDHYGARFKLNEENMAKHVALIEKQTAQKYATQVFKQEKITEELKEVGASKFFILKYKLSIDEETIYRTIYTVMLAENRRNLTFTFDNYNKGKVDLDAFVLAFT